MSEKKKNSAVMWLVVLCIAVSLGIWWAFMVGSTIFIYGLGIFNLLFGPICLLFYLREVKKGVFKGDDEETAVE